MSPEEIYQKALDIAQEALEGAERKVEKFTEHLAGAKDWLDEAQRVAGELEAKGLDGFLADLGVEQQPEPEQPTNKGSGAAGAAALDASATTVDGA